MWEDMTECDLLVGSGDLNCRTKQIIEYLPDIDGDLIPPRHNPDLTKSSHADSFISFLKDSRSIILNGRVTPDYNNFTFVSPRGCSVPDYSPIDQLPLCTEMEKMLISDIAVEFNIHPPKSLPDYSIIQGTFITSFYSKLQNFPPKFPPYIPSQDKIPSSKPKKKNLKKMSNEL